MKPHAPPVADFKLSRWPGLIWALPVAAVLLVGWLAANAWAHRGPSVTVVLPIAGGVKAGSTKVHYNGFEVGEVHSVSLSKDLRHLIVELDFESSMEGHLGPSTRYWIAGDTVDLNNLDSIKAVLSGPYIGVEPKPGKTVKRVVGLLSPPNPHPPSPDAVAYTAVFATGPHGLKAGDSVDLEGTTVGSVTRVEMSYVPAEHAIQTSVEFALEPDEIGLKGQAWNRAAPRRQMDAMITDLIEHGLRAQMGASVPVVGPEMVKLTLAKDEPPAHLLPGTPPGIPTLGAGPEFDDLVRQLDATIREAQQAVQQARSLLSTEGMKNSGVENSDLPHALYEMSRAAESLRELTDYLNSHPNALIFGRPH